MTSPDMDDTDIKNSGMTPLDRAYREVQADIGRAENYYNLFLNTLLYMPVWDRLADVDSRRLGPGDTLNPVTTSDGDRHYLMLFDSERRLLDWAAQDVGVACVLGHELIRLIDRPDIFWALNVGTDYAKEFTPDEVRVVREAMALVENS